MNLVNVTSFLISNMYPAALTLKIFEDHRNLNINLSTNSQNEIDHTVILVVTYWFSFQTFEKEN